MAARATPCPLGAEARSKPAGVSLGGTGLPTCDEHRSQMPSPSKCIGDRRSTPAAFSRHSGTAQAKCSRRPAALTTASLTATRPRPPREAKCSMAHKARSLGCHCSSPSDHVSCAQNARQSDEDGKPRHDTKSASSSATEGSTRIDLCRLQNSVSNRRASSSPLFRGPSTCATGAGDHSRGLSMSRAWLNAPEGARAAGAPPLKNSPRSAINFERPSPSAGKAATSSSTSSSSSGHRRCEALPSFMPAAHCSSICTCVADQEEVLPRHLLSQT
mmetsp:Transcript_84255/g.243536  ORF Transcript_84255/g.243536 Transcript_84255/m.243536 type:complete len:273 (+) Transcript_84255:121-939(+)